MAPIPPTEVTPPPPPPPKKELNLGTTGLTVSSLLFCVMSAVQQVRDLNAVWKFAVGSQLCS